LSDQHGDGSLHLLAIFGILSVGFATMLAADHFIGGEASAWFGLVVIAIAFGLPLASMYAQSMEARA